MGQEGPAADERLDGDTVLDSPGHEAHALDVGEAGAVALGALVQAANTFDRVVVAAVDHMVVMAKRRHGQGPSQAHPAAAPARGRLVGGWISVCGAATPLARRAGESAGGTVEGFDTWGDCLGRAWWRGQETAGRRCARGSAAAARHAHAWHGR